MKLSRDDPRAKHIATDTEVDRDGLAEFLAGKHRWVLATTRADGRPQMSLVTGGITDEGVLAISTYPDRAKAKNVRRNAAVSVLVMGNHFSSAWIQVDGDARVLDMPDAAEGLVEYYRCISGEHPDWDEYRQAMADQGKSVILVEPTRWGPISKGGFPASLFEDAADQNEGAAEVARDRSPWISDLEWQRAPKQARSRATRDALLDAVEEQLAASTVDELTLADVAEGAGCSVGSVYHHFQNKQALVYAMLDRLADETLATIEAAAEPERWEGASIEDVVRGYLQFALGFARDAPGVTRAKLRLALEDAAVDAQLQKVAAALDEALTRLLRARRDEIGHPDPDRAIAFVLDQLAAQIRARAELPGVHHNLPRDDDTFLEQTLASVRAFLRL